MAISVAFVCGEKLFGEEKLLLPMASQWSHWEENKPIPLSCFLPNQSSVSTCEGYKEQFLALLATIESDPTQDTKSTSKARGS